MTWAEEIKAFREEVSASFAIFSRTPHSAILWTTTVIAVYVVDLDDDITDVVREAVDAYHQERAVTFRRSGRTYRSIRGWTRWCGVIEVDVIHPSVARLCSRRKASLLAELGIDVTKLKAEQRVLIVHEHAIVDHRGHASADTLKRDMRITWPGVRRVHTARLYTEGTIAQNLEQLAGYATKFALRYAVAWDDRKTSFQTDFEPEWREYMRRLYRGIGFSRLLTANVASQASVVSKNFQMHNSKRDCRAKMTANEPSQLCLHQENNCVIYKEEDDSIEENSEKMKVEDIIGNHIDTKAIEADTLRDLKAALARRPTGLSLDELPIMYGDPDEELRLEKKRLENLKIRAEIAKTMADVSRDLRGAGR